MEEGWRKANEKDRMVILEEEKEFMQHAKRVLLWAETILGAVIILIIFICQSFKGEEIAQEILGYSPTGPPDYYMVQAMNDMEEYGMLTSSNPMNTLTLMELKEKYVENQRKEIEEARSDGLRQAGFLYIKYYIAVLVIYGIIYITGIFVLKGYYKKFRDEIFFVCNAKCIEKDVVNPHIRYFWKDMYKTFEVMDWRMRVYNSYILTLRLDNNEIKDVVVPFSTFKKVGIGAQLLAVYFEKSLMPEKVEYVYINKNAA